MIVGARIGASVHMPLLRRTAKWFLTRLANYLSGTTIPDLNSGLRVFRRAVAMRFYGIIADGFSFTSTVTLAMLTNGYAVKFVPIDYHVRTGSSKIRPVRDTLNFLLLIVRVVTYFNPLKVFLPASVVLLLLGVIFGLYQIIGSGFHGIGQAPVLLILAGTQIAFMGLLAEMISKK
jgi:hypothetical protein